MLTYTNIIIAIMMPAVIFLALFQPARKVAIRLGLVDKPNARKQHKGTVPLIGGILIFLSVLITQLLMEDVLRDFSFLKVIFISGGLLTMMGVLDDRFDIRATIKLFIQLVLAHLAIQNGFMITSFFGILGIQELSYPLQYVISLLAIVGFVNAFNLMDGIDGLAGSFALFSIAILAALAYIAGADFLFLVLLSFIPAIVVFLVFNTGKKHKIFMGDAGSLFLGYLIILSGIHLMGVIAIDEKSLNNIAILLCILFIPIMDSLRVYLLRINQGGSPFKADRNHLHHLFLAGGYSPLKSTIYIVSTAVLFILIVVFSGDRFDINWTIFILLGCFITLIALLRYNAYIKEWTEKIKKF
jgi:UDP-GlcNAc:undecaprenyl-phosphate GlcNAc-1-phosphate transferase